ncbi:hypothetical protein Prum_090690 [Phytohabitans rumicis]|uniref:Glycosyltransferase 2-like domain-containing protein n=1 Tax=Phytohabitans rumicis TaxID=1076125 RepID=A0A6V8LMV9_9ACTN|nr:hypothetical protein Prum_090690 [Phytohabitans rumicis]
MVPAFENAAELDVTLGSLARQTMPPGEFEVVVADDGSAAPLAPVVDKYADRIDVRCVRDERNRGRSANRNAGAAHARAAVLVFLDSDTVAHPDLIRRHWAFHASRAGRPGVLLGRRLDCDWAAGDALRRGEIPAAPLVDHYRGDPRDAHCSLPQHWQDFRRAPWLLGFTHNASVDRATFLAAGGFDETMVKWGLEDNEMFYRVFHHHGGPPDLFEVDRDAVAYHLPHYRRTGELLGTMDNLRYVARKHPRYEFEAMHSQGTLGQVMGRVRLYGDAVAACRREGLGRPDHLPAPLRETLAAGSALAIGFGVAKLPLGPGSYTFDHDAPLGETNWHRVGLMLHDFKAGQFDVLVNVDLWRFLLPEDLSLHLTKGLRKADRIDLVASRTALDPASLLPLPFVTDLPYLADLLHPSLKVELAQYPQVTVLSVR